MHIRRNAPGEALCAGFGSKITPSCKNRTRNDCPSSFHQSVGTHRPQFRGCRLTKYMVLGARGWHTPPAPWRNAKPASVKSTSVVNTAVRKRLSIPDSGWGDRRAERKVHVRASVTRKSDHVCRLLTARCHENQRTTRVPFATNRNVGVSDQRALRPCEWRSTWSWRHRMHL